jgi:hypothetical protein
MIYKCARYLVVVKGCRTIRHNVYAESYDAAQQVAIENTLACFPETKAKDWEVIETKYLHD